MGSSIWTKTNDLNQVVRVYGYSKRRDTQIHHAIIAHKIAHLQNTKRVVPEICGFAQFLA